MDRATSPSHGPWRVVCLCAQWCGTCRDWREPLAQVARDHPHWLFSWVDIEDEADAVGDLDIETFPTLLIARGDEVKFMGPVLPFADQLARLLASLQAQGKSGTAVPAEAPSLLQRLLAHGLLAPLTP